MLATEVAINAAPYLGAISHGVMWLGLITVVILFGKHIVRGVAMAVTECLLTSGDNAEKIARWFTSNKEVVVCMKYLIEKLGDDPDKIIKDNK